MSGLRQNNQTEIELRGDYNTIYDAIIKSAKTVGNVTQENRNMGFVSLKTPMKLFPPINSVNLKITIKKSNDENYTVKFDADSLDGLAGMGSCGKIIDKFIQDLSSRI